MMCEFNRGEYDAKIVILFLASNEFKSAVFKRLGHLRKPWCHPPLPFIYVLLETPADQEEDQKQPEELDLDTTNAPYSDLS